MSPVMIGRSRAALRPAADSTIPSTMEISQDIRQKFPPMSAEPLSLSERGDIPRPPANGACSNDLSRTKPKPIHGDSFDFRANLIAGVATLRACRQPTLGAAARRR